MFLKFKKLFKNFILIFAVFCLVLVGNGQVVSADVYEPLNNLADEAGVTHKKVSGESIMGGDNTSDLRVELRNQTDQVVLYQLATVAWTDNTYQDPEWTPEILAWLETYAEETSPEVMDIIRSPKLLGAASSSVWATFYSGLLGDAELVAKISEASTLAGVPGAAYTTETPEGQEQERYYAEFSNLAFGTYAVVVTNETYAPLVINIVPERTASGYTVSYVYETSLKEHMSSVDKKINGKEYDTVAVGDVVNFQIEFEVPTLTQKTSNLVLTDEMSKAFRFNGDEGDVSIQYQDASDHSIYHKMNNDVTTAGTLYEVVKTIDQSSGTPLTYLTITFHTEALKLWLERNDTPSELYKIMVSYQATVTSKAEYGTENNYNKAILDTGDNADVLTDTVRAYTYAVNVLKLDGSSADQPKDMNPLAGAVFALYKEAYIFVNGVWKGTVKAPIHGEQFVSYEKDNEPEMTLEEMKADSTNYYIYEEVASADGVITGLTEEEGTYQANDKIARVFCLAKLGDDVGNFDGTFISVDSRDGYTISGLNVGNYVLSETTPPSGYSALAEDLMFGIIRMSNEDAELLNNGSLSSFYEQNEKLNHNGCLEVVVLNYRGLTLPSTGGRGTVLFIMIGLFLMMFATIIVFIRKGNQKYREYM